jgi:hypothetical protein
MVKQCFECGTTEDLNEHHVIPRSRGGTKTIPLCYSCHCRAHGRDSKGLEHGRLIREGIKRRHERNPSARSRWGAGHSEEAAARSVKLMHEGIQRKADNFAFNYGRLASTAYSEGLSYRAVAAMLNDAGIQTPRGKSKWSAPTTRALILRYRKLTEET